MSLVTVGRQTLHSRSSLRRVQQKSSPTRQEVLETLPNFWPICTVLITITQISMFTAVCVYFGLAPISFVPVTETREVVGFDGFNMTETRDITPNFFIGPSSESLVHVGAQYTPVSSEHTVSHDSHHPMCHM